MSLPPIPPRPITVLHVDDDPQFTELVEAFLGRIDPELQVIDAHDAQRALELLDARSHEIDCVVSDYDMPGRDGLELRRAVRDGHGDVPFILLTGKGSEEIASEAISVGVSDYIQKSSGSEVYELLANRIRSQTEKHRAERHVRQVYEAVDVMREGISLLDSAGRFIFVNAAYADVFGYTSDELVGRHWEVLYRDSEDAAYMEEEVLTVVRSDRPWRGKTRQVSKDGGELLTDHTLVYTSEGMMACLVREDDSRLPESDVPVVDVEDAA